jgi:hypothetical protein
VPGRKLSGKIFNQDKFELAVIINRNQSNPNNFKATGVVIDVYNLVGTYIKLSGS